MFLKMFHKWRRPTFQLGLILLDFVLIVVSFIVSFSLSMDTEKPVTASLILRFASVSPLWILLFSAMNLYTIRRSWKLENLLTSILMAVTFGALLFVLIDPLLRYYFNFPSIMVRYLWCSLTLLALFPRLFLREALKILAGNNLFLKRIVIVGNNDPAEILESAIRSHPQFGLKICGRILGPHHSLQRQDDVPIDSFQGNPEAVIREVLVSCPHQIIFAEPIRDNPFYFELATQCQEKGIEVSLIPELYERFSSKVTLHQVGEMPIISLNSNPLAFWERVSKRFIDVVLSGFLFVLSLPLLAFMALLLRSRNQSPLFLRQKRVGQSGKSFFMYRFRILPDIDLNHLDTAQEEESETLRTHNPLAYFLIKNSLDELPQLWNVLKGDMSLVGPRPESEERVRYYTAWNRRRLQLKPGLTGLAQIRGLRGSSPSTMKSIEDIRYIETYSMWLDFKILLLTPFAVFKRRRLVNP